MMMIACRDSACQHSVLEHEIHGDIRGVNTVLMIWCKECNFTCFSTRKSFDLNDQFRYTTDYSEMDD